MKQPYNRVKEKKYIRELVSKQSENEKIKYYQVAFYYNFNGNMECFSEFFYSPEQEDLAKSYLKYRNGNEVRVFIVYEDGYKKELF